MRPPLVVVLALVCSGLLASRSPVRAEMTQTVWSGTVGQAGIVLELTESDDGISGRYFYRRIRRDIPLEGERHGAALALRADTTGDVLQLTRSGAAYAGTLTTRTGSSRPVALHRAVPEPSATPDAAAAVPPAFTLYERLRFQGTRFQLKGRSVQSGRSIAHYVETASGRELFRLEGGYAPAAMAAINAALAARQLEEADQFLSCTSREGGPGVEESFADPPYLSDSYVSVTWHASWDCATAAHPDSGSSSVTFDARTGRRLQLEDVLWFGKGTPPAEDTPAWSDYRSSVFAPRIVALLTRLYPADMARPPHPDEECDYSDPAGWSSLGWSMTPKGLALHYYASRVARMCDDPSFAVIPYPVLASLRR